MSRVIILHGKPDEDEYFDHSRPSESNHHWIPWLQRQLQLAGHDVQTPEVFNSFRPDYDVWSHEFERHITGEPMVLIGHSCGAGFLVRWLSGHPAVTVARLLLVAPWLDPDRTGTMDFFDFAIDDRLPIRIGSFHIFHSADDYEDVRASVAILLEHFPDVIEHAYEDMGHFVLPGMGTERFPDLRDAAIGDVPSPAVAGD